jgi:hypothetical protein
VGTPRATKPGKEKLTEVEKEKAQVREQCIKQRKENPEAGGTTWVYVAKKEKPKGTPQKTARNQTKIGDYLGKKPTSTPTRKLTAEEVRAAVGMEIDDKVTESDDGISEVLAQREAEVMGPFAGADDSSKGGRKQANKKGLAPLENTATEGLITAAEAKRRARREKEEEEAQEERIQTAVRILHRLCQKCTCPLPPLKAAGRAVKYSRKHSLDKENGGLLVALMRRDSAPDADAFAVFVELNLVISTPIQRSRHSFGVGRLFMLEDFPAKYQQTNPREMRDVTLSKVAHLALGEGVPEHLKRQNRAFLASVEGLTFQQDELQTMTWADFGFRINCEPIQTQLISTWITLPGDVAENYLNVKKVDFKVVLKAVRIWKEAGKSHRINSYTHERNVAGLDALRKTYHDLKKAARKERVSLRNGVNRTSRGPSCPMRVPLRDREKMRKTRLIPRIQTTTIRCRSPFHPSLRHLRRNGRGPKLCRIAKCELGLQG